jgi:hypothetical protein
MVSLLSSPPWKRVFALICSLSLLLEAKTEPQQRCGESWTRRLEERHLTERAQLARFAATGSVLSLVNAPASAASTIDTPGNLVVMPDTDGIRQRRNPFNLQLRRVAFQPVTAEAQAYKIESGESLFDPAVARNGATLDGLDDDDTREVRLPFAFRYFGESYTSVFVNSDGNVTFGTGDGSSSDRSFSRMAGGSPRVSALFSDLDPSIRGASVSTFSEPERFVVSWNEVPFYGGFASQSFQIVLRPSGRIEFHYGDTSVAGEDAVVGISPGFLIGDPKLRSLAFETTVEEFNGPIAEIFAGRESYDVTRAVQRFYQTHDDAYDIVFVFNALQMPPALCPQAIACTDVIRNGVTGFGRSQSDEGAIYGSPKRLEAVIDMGPVDGYPLNPYADHPSRVGTGDKGINIFGHEASHRYLVWLKSPVDNFGNNIYTGRQGLHWNFNFNSEGSLVEGNRIVDQGEGANPRFFSAGAGERVSPVDQYFFGWRAADEVPPTFVVRNSSITNPSAAPLPGSRFNGIRQDVTIEELVGIVGGPRYPDSAIAPRKYRWAVILITRDGAPLPAAGIDKLERYLAELPGFWGRVSEGRSELDMTLRRSIDVSLAPFAELAADETRQGTIRLARPAEAPLTIAIERDVQDRLDTTAESLTIPAGAVSADFTIRAKNPGVTLLTFRPSDPQFETVETRIRVQ